VACPRTLRPCLGHQTLDAVALLSHPVDKLENSYWADIMQGFISTYLLLDRSFPLRGAAKEARSQLKEQDNDEEKKRSANILLVDKWVRLEKRVFWNWTGDENVRFS
jgi:hypothetical protein